MKSYLKFLSRNKVYTLVNIVGLSVSLAFVIIIGLYAQMEFGRDKWHEKADRIYSVCDESHDEVYEQSHWCMQSLLRSQFPEIENSCAALNCEAEMKLGNQEKQMVRVMSVDSTFFQLFDFPLTLGDRQRVLEKPNAMVLSEATARLLFGSSDPLGKTVTLNDSLTFEVTGVMPQLNHTYMKTFDVMVSTDMAAILTHNGDRFKDETMNSYGQCRVYLLAREGCDLCEKEEAINSFVSKRIWLFKEDSPFPSRLKLCPLTEIYFKKIGTYGEVSHGDSQQAWLLAMAGLVILLFAVMNYINLTMALSTFRMREMAMRRLLGSQRSGVMARLMSESVMICLLSLVLAVVLVAVTEPYVNWLVNTHSSLWYGALSNNDIDIIQTSDLWRPVNLLAIVGFTLLLGVVAGIGPAIATSSAHPIEVVRGKFRRMSKMYFSRVFITLQHVCTIVLIGMALVMWLQVRHLVSAPLGYNTGRVLAVRPPEIGMAFKKMKPLFDELSKLSGIEQATIGLGGPMTGGSNSTEKHGERTISFQYFWNSEGWLKLLEIPVITDYGTKGKDGERIFVTRKCLELEDLPADARSMKFQGYTIQIDGIIEDIRLGGILDDMDNPLVVSEKPQNFGFEILVKYSGSKQEAIEQVRSVYERIFEVPMQKNYCMGYDDILLNMFSKEIRILRLLTVFAVIAVIVSLLGLLAMSTYYIQQRRKEVAVRKVFGSTNGEMLVRLLRQFVIYVAVAFVIAVPIIYKVAGDWLSQFSYRIGLSVWIFVVAGFTCFLISLLTVIIQSWLAANENPINNIKTE